MSLVVIFPLHFIDDFDSMCENDIFFSCLAFSSLAIEENREDREQLLRKNVYFFAFAHHYKTSLMIFSLFRACTTTPYLFL